MKPGPPGAKIFSVILRNMPVLFFAHGRGECEPQCKRVPVGVVRLT